MHYFLTERKSWTLLARFLSDYSEAKLLLLPLGLWIGVLGLPLFLLQTGICAAKSDSPSYYCLSKDNLWTYPNFKFLKFT